MHIRANAITARINTGKRSIPVLIGTCCSECAREVLTKKRMSGTRHLHQQEKVTNAGWLSAEDSGIQTRRAQGEEFIIIYTPAEAAVLSSELEQ